jgi:hypothetical protein
MNLPAMQKNRGNTSVVRELDRAARNNQFSASVVTDVSRLLESPEQKDKVRLMRELGWDKVITRTETFLGKEKERTNLMEKFSSTSVSKIEEIRDVAVTYGLKFLPATRFLCPEQFEMELASMIMDFHKNHGLDYSDHSKNNFFVLADESYFKSRRLNIDDDIGVFIFYRPPKEESNFLRVDHIGTGQLSFWRYLKGWSGKNMTNSLVNAGLLLFFITFPFFALFGVAKAFILSLIAATAGVFLEYKKAEKRGGFNIDTWNMEPKMD